MYTVTPKEHFLSVRFICPGHILFPLDELRLTPYPYNACQMVQTMFFGVFFIKISPLELPSSYTLFTVLS